MREKEHKNWISKNNMPHPHLRENFEWVKDFKHCEVLENQRENLITEKEDLRQRPRALADIKKVFIFSLENHQKLARRNELEKFILTNSGHPDPIFNLRFLPPDSILRTPEISEKEWEKTFSDLEKSSPPEAISDAARKKKNAEFDKKISAIEKELAQFPDYGKWQEFLVHWQDMQASCDAAVNPQGFEIQISRPEEIEAFKKLNLGKLVNASNRFHPARS